MPFCNGVMYRGLEHPTSGISEEQSEKYCAHSASFFASLRALPCSLQGHDSQPISVLLEHLYMHFEDRMKSKR